eukprot:CAMPEP_0174707804 /NCGR_PEP_ID=MMETSP1094-20130205/10221_1 /TAXON_ID=156173 /ORGANISM="Chrysochromulina brevifilum, Strain UTEX LB 985" /LENGTH=224 /DNA_ID=CAMNT_0015906245 /DNA_START=158 /DNA_END=829 /DNA_ORIENTATION=+
MTGEIPSDKPASVSGAGATQADVQAKAQADAAGREEEEARRREEAATRLQAMKRGSSARALVTDRRNTESEGGGAQPHPDASAPEHRIHKERVTAREGGEMKFGHHQPKASPRTMRKQSVVGGAAIGAGRAAFLEAKQRKQSMLQSAETTVLRETHVIDSVKQEVRSSELRSSEPRASGRKVRMTGEIPSDKPASVSGAGATQADVQAKAQADAAGREEEEARR